MHIRIHTNLNKPHPSTNEWKYKSPTWFSWLLRQVEIEVRVVVKLKNHCCAITHAHDGIIPGDVTRACPVLRIPAVCHIIITVVKSEAKSCFCSLIDK